MKISNPLLEEYAGYLETIKGLSKNTIKSYTYDIVVFMRYLKLRFSMVSETTEFEAIDISDVNIDILSDLSLPDLYGFLTFTAKQRGNTDYGRIRKIAALKSFYKYIVDKRKLIKENPMLELERPRLGSSLPIYLTLDDALKLLSSIQGRNKERDYAMITLFLNCGLRLNELTNIRISSIKGDTLRVIGKGGKERTIYLNNASINAINAYLEVRKKLDNPYLFLSEQNLKISNRAVQHAVKNHIKKAGLDADKISVHKLRHTAATLMYKYGETDLRALQKILGHSSVATTQIYTHVDDDALRDAVKKNPLSDL